jgi:predicted phosphohydrolase
MELLAFGHGKLQFGIAARSDEQQRRHKRHPHVFNLLFNFPQFRALEQQFPFSPRILGHITGIGIFGHVHVVNPKFSSIQPAVRFCDARLARADGLNFRA